MAREEGRQMRTRTFGLAGVLVWVAACGPGRPGVAEDGASASGEGSTGEDSGDPTGESDATETEGDDEADCQEYDDDPVSGPGARVTVRNDSPEPIFLASPYSCETSYFGVEAINGLFPNPSCGNCEGEGPCEACPKFCGFPPVVRVEPGGEFSIVWAGQVHEAVTLPVECALDGCDQLGCRARREASPGPIVVTAARYGDPVCADPEADACQCEPNGAGHCFPDVSGGEFAVVITATAQATYGDDEVVVSFE